MFATETSPFYMHMKRYTKSSILFIIRATACQHFAKQKRRLPLIFGDLRQFADSVFVEKRQGGSPREKASFLLQKQLL